MWSEWSGRGVEFLQGQGEERTTGPVTFCETPLGEGVDFFEVEVFVEVVGLFEEGLDFGGIEVGGEGLGAVGYGEGGDGGGGGALIEVFLDDGVEGVGGFVVEFEVEVSVGPEDEGGDAEDVEGGVVGFEEVLGVVGGLVGAEAGEEGGDGFEGGFFVFAAHEIPALGGLGAGVGDEDGVDVREVCGVGADVGGGSEEALFFAAEEDKADGSAGWLGQGLDGAGDLKDGADAGAVVLSSGAGVPGVEMGADEDDLVDEVAAGDLGDDVGDGDVLADAVGEGELEGDGAGVGGAVEQAFEEGGVFVADLGFGEGFEVAGEVEGGEGFGAVGTAGGEDGGGMEGAEAIEAGEEQLEGGFFAEGFVIKEGDVAVDLAGEAIENAGGEGGDIEDGSFDGGGGGGAPAIGVEVEGVIDGSKDAAGGGVGLPGGGDGPGFGVNVGEAEFVKVCLGPSGGAHVVRGAGEAGADGVGELAVVLVSLPVEEDVAEELADGGAGVGGDGGGGGGLSGGVGGSDGGDCEDEGRGTKACGDRGFGGHSFRYTQVGGVGAWALGWGGVYQV